MINLTYDQPTGDLLLAENTSSVISKDRVTDHPISLKGLQLLSLLIIYINNIQQQKVCNKPKSAI